MITRDEVTSVMEGFIEAPEYRHIIRSVHENLGVTITMHEAKLFWQVHSGDSGVPQVLPTDPMELAKIFEGFICSHLKEELSDEFFVKSLRGRETHTATELNRLARIAGVSITWIDAPRGHAARLVAVKLFSAIRLKNASPIVRFYHGHIASDSGWMIDDILGFTNFQMEHIHDYIQWLFPLNEGSAFNRNAPILTELDIEHLVFNDEAQALVLTAVIRFIEFLEATKKDWTADSNNHNCLRITRCLKFLKLLNRGDGLEKIFYEKVIEILKSEGAVSRFDTAFTYWDRAICRSQRAYRRDNQSEMLKLALRLTQLHFPVEFETVDAVSIGDMLDDIDWYANRWTPGFATDKESGFHPVAGVPGAWDVYMEREPGRIILHY